MAARYREPGFGTAKFGTGEWTSSHDAKLHHQSKPPHSAAGRRACRSLRAGRTGAQRATINRICPVVGPVQSRMRWGQVQLRGTSSEMLRGHAARVGVPGNRRRGTEPVLASCSTSSTPRLSGALPGTSTAVMSWDRCPPQSPPCARQNRRLLLLGRGASPGRAPVRPRPWAKLGSTGGAVIRRWAQVPPARNCRGELQQVIKLPPMFGTSQFP